jgi:hypothetical protein
MTEGKGPLHHRAGREEIGDLYAKEVIGNFHHYDTVPG